MSEVALADDTGTSVRDKAFIKSANVTVAVGSVFTIMIADAAVADSPFGDAVLTADGADEAVFVTIALVFAIPLAFMGREISGNTHLSQRSRLFRYQLNS